MPVLTGLKTGLVTGLVDGLGSILASGLSVLTTLDFSVGPTAQSFPTTAAGLAAALGDANATPSYIWLCDEASGNLIDEIASEPLVPTNSPLQNRSANGIGGVCVETSIAGWNMSFASDDNTVMDASLADFAFICVFRMSRKQTVNSGLLNKQLNDASAGYAVGLGSGSGFKFRCHDGTNSHQLTHSSPILDDGAWHVIMCRYDHSAEMMYAYADTGTGAVSLDTSIGSGDFTNTQTFRLGASPSVGNPSDGIQYRYFAFFSGATACDPLTQTALDTFWTHGDSPVTLNTASRASTIGYWSAAGAISHHAKEAVPIVYEPVLSGYGLLTNKATTNLLTYSNASTGATNTNVTAADYNAAGADGTLNATKLTASADNGYQSRSGTTVASTAYCASVFVKEVAGSEGATGRVIIYDTTGAAEVASQVFTASSTWQRIEVSGSHSNTATEVRVEIDTNTKAVCVSDWQLELGTNPSHVIRTEGATAASVAGHYKANISHDNKSGELAAVWCRHNYVAGAATSYVTFCEPSTGTGNARALTTDTATQINALIYDDAGTLEDTISQSVVADGTKYTTRHLWDDSAGGSLTGGKEHRLAVNASTYDGAASPWDGDTSNTVVIEEVHLGHASNANHMNGVIESVISYDSANGDMP